MRTSRYACVHIQLLALSHNATHLSNGVYFTDATKLIHPILDTLWARSSKTDVTSARLLTRQRRGKYYHLVGPVFPLQLSCKIEVPGNALAIGNPKLN